MARGLIVLSVAAVVFWVFSIVDCAVQPATRHRGVPKRAWIAIVVLLPVVGGLMWFIVGRARGKRPSVAPVAPDDDPEFLGSIGTISDQDERIRRLEEELARLDDEPSSATGSVSEPGDADRRADADDAATDSSADDDHRGNDGTRG